MRQFSNSINQKKMQSSSLMNSSALFTASKSHGRKRNWFGPIKGSMGGSADQNMSGRLVDESMIILRKRIHEMKRNYEAPSHWMDWEKRYYTKYDSTICEAVGLLQTHLMNTRPSLALAAITLFAITVPTSSILLFFHFLHLFCISPSYH
ncbi:hypothetical protein VNO78_19133 [Psophocarpus tetragonolobus]|uniref:Uncharacterized protein n=1 Tax=Psophocarpus tetragonolobus TaxID=3891 RepID=A0AAN9SBM0_PSOTE